MKKKKFISFFAGILALAVVAGSLAYYNATTTINNEMSTKKSGFETSEKFTPKDDWQPGSEVTKEVGVTNTGDYPLLVRIKMSETWTLADGSTLTIHSKDKLADNTTSKFQPATATTDLQEDKGDGLTAGDGSVVYKKLDLTKWTFDATDGYWYYNSLLAVGDTTDNLLESITLFKDADLGIYDQVKYYTKKTGTKPDNTEIGTSDADAASKWVLYTTSTVPGGATFNRVVSTLKDGFTGYANADYTLTITTEVYQGTAEGRTAAIGTAGWSSTSTPNI